MKFGFVGRVKFVKTVGQNESAINVRSKIHCATLCSRKVRCMAFSYENDAKNNCINIYDKMPGYAHDESGLDLWLIQ